MVAEPWLRKVHGRVQLTALVLPDRGGAETARRGERDEGGPRRAASQSRGLAVELLDRQLSCLSLSVVGFGVLGSAVELLSLVVTLHLGVSVRRLRCLACC